MTGRPSSFTPEVGDAICLRLSEGESLRAICADADMPSLPTVLRWARDNDIFREQYIRAREDQAHVIAQQAVDEAIAAADPALGRLAFDARRWFAGKVAPKVYGDKQSLEHSGPGGAPLTVEIVRFGEGKAPE